MQFQLPKYRAIDVAALRVCILVSLALVLVNFIWFFLDHHIPNQDEAGHILNSISFMELFANPRPWRGYWWHELFSVNTFYPPFVYAVSGLLKCLLGPARWVDVLVCGLFTFILSSSTIFTLVLLEFSLPAACAAAVIVNLFPAAAALNHSYMLDFPLLAMVSLGIFSLCYWRQNPTYRRSVIAGAILGLSCLTKQIAAVYLAGPGLLFFLEACFLSTKKKRTSSILQLLLAAAICALVAGPFFLFSYHAMKELTDTIKTEMQSTGADRTVFDYLFRYLTRGFSSLLSPLLYGTAIVSAVLVGKASNIKLLPVWSSFLFGVCAMSCLVSFPFSTRYIIPALCLPAALLAIVLLDLWHSKNWMKMVVALTVSLLAIFQYVSFNFCPYPISAPAILVDLAPSLGLSEPDQLSDSKEHRCPEPSKNWGYDWVLDEIHKKDKDAPVYLNVVSNSYNLNAHTFQLYAKERKSAVRPTTSLHHTVVGDKFDFDPEKALYFHWYLIKSDSSGYPLADDSSRLNMQKLKKFLCESGRFSEMNSLRLEDGTKLILYRMNN